MNDSFFFFILQLEIWWNWILNIIRPHLRSDVNIRGTSSIEDFSFISNANSNCHSKRQTMDFMQKSNFSFLFFLLFPPKSLSLLSIHCVYIATNCYKRNQPTKLILNQIFSESHGGHQIIINHPFHPIHTRERVLDRPGGCIAEAAEACK